MTSTVQAPQQQAQEQLRPALTAQPRVQQITCSSVLYDITEVVSQVVIRVLFVAAHILIATTFLPLAWHWAAVPVAAVGSTFIAAFFFPKPQFSQNGIVAPVANVFREEPRLPANYPPGSPVGYRNQSADCSFNATAHLIDSIPLLSLWMRQPLGADKNEQEFIQLLNEYNTPATMILAFQAFIQNREAPIPTVREMFLEFLQNYQPEAEDAFEAGRVKGIFRAHDVIREFYRLNDAAVQERLAISAGDSRNIREALSLIHPLIRPGNEQIGADEVASAVFDTLMPNAMKMEIEQTYHLNMQGMPALQAPLEPRRETIGLFKIHLGNEVNPTFQTLLQNTCNSGDVESVDRLDVNGTRRSYPVERSTIEFRTAPPMLNFWIARFRNVPPPEGWYNNWLGYMHQNYPRMSYYLLQRPIGWTQAKIETPIEFPEILTIRLQNGEERQYRLRSYVTHQGSDNRGHYVEGEIRNGERFFLNDTLSTWVQTPAHQENWTEQLRKAYLVCYVPEPADAAD